MEQKSQHDGPAVGNRCALDKATSRKLHGTVPGLAEAISDAPHGEAAEDLARRHANAGEADDLKDATWRNWHQMEV